MYIIVLPINSQRIHVWTRPAGSFTMIIVWFSLIQRPIAITSLRIITLLEALSRFPWSWFPNHNNMTWFVMCKRCTELWSEHFLVQCHARLLAVGFTIYTKKISFKKTHQGTWNHKNTITIPKMDLVPMVRFLTWLTRVQMLPLQPPHVSNKGQKDHNPRLKNDKSISAKKYNI